PGSQLLTQQTVQRSGNTLMNLVYWYQQSYGCEGCDVNPDPEAPPSPAAYTGQLTRIIDNVSGKTSHFSYDLIGRLVQAEEGAVHPHPQPPQFFADWGQTYSYDRYGNRTTVSPYSDTGTAIPDGYQS